MILRRLFVTFLLLTATCLRGSQAAQAPCPTNPCKNGGNCFPIYDGLRCPSGSHPWGSSCYLLVEERLTWAEALRYCQNYAPRTTLAAIETFDEKQFIEGLLQRKASGQVSIWIGAQRREGIWTWEPSNKLVDLTFAGKELKLLPQSDCMVVGAPLYREIEGVPCDQDKLFSICEMPQNLIDPKLENAYQCRCDRGFHGYDCETAATDSVKSSFFCGNQSVSLECLPGSFMFVEYAAYIYDPPAAPRCYRSLPPPGQLCFAENTLFKLRRRCNGHASCSIKTSLQNSFRNEDPCALLEKHLEVRYSCISGRSSCSDPQKEILIDGWCYGTSLEALPWAKANETCYRRANEKGVEGSLVVLPRTTAARMAISTLLRRSAASNETHFWLDRVADNPNPAADDEDENELRSNAQEQLPRSSCLQLTWNENVNGSLISMRESRCDEMHPYICQCEPPELFITKQLNITLATGGPTRPMTARPEGVRSCLAVLSRGISWPKTAAGETATMRCPGKATGHATWVCSAETLNFRPESGPNLSNCINSGFAGLQDELDAIAADQGEFNPYVGFDKLMGALRGNSMLGGDVKVALTVADRVVDGLSSEDTLKMLSDLLDISSILLSANNIQSWSDLSTAELATEVSKVFSLVEKIGFKASHALRSSELAVVKENINLRIVASSGVLQTAVSLGKVEVIIPLHAIPEGTDREHSVFAAYRNLDLILSRTVSPPMQTRQRVINSAVLSASIGSPEGSLQFANASRARFIFKNLETYWANPDCVFWNMTSPLYWENTSCFVVEKNRSHTVCECEHLTNFAILMDTLGAYRQISPEDRMALLVITYIGCIVSIVTLLLAIVIFSVFRGLYSDRNTIHRNLCITLLLGEITFVVGIDRTESKIGCAVVAALLHYLFLSCFVWMCLEGIQIYLLLVKVFDTSERRKTPLYYIVGYVAPAIVVTVAAAIGHQNYGTPDHCWIRFDNHFIWSFAGPVLLVVLVNCIFLMIAMKVVLSAHSGKTTGGMPKGKRFLGWIKGSLMLLCLLGVTWVFGLLFVNEFTVVFAYVFTVLNSFQGLFIFIFHVCINDKVHQEIRRCIRKSTCCPRCIKDKYVETNGSDQSKGTSKPKRRGRMGSNHTQSGARSSQSSNDTQPTSTGSTGIVVSKSSLQPASERESLILSAENLQNTAHSLDLLPPGGYYATSIDRNSKKFRPAEWKIRRRGWSYNVSSGGPLGAEGVVISRTRQYASASRATGVQREEEIDKDDEELYAIVSKDVVLQHFAKKTDSMLVTHL